MLRDYQAEIVTSVMSKTSNCLIQADTGAGKTRILSEIASKYKHVLVVAHRNVLVAQLSIEFARSGLKHSVIAAKQTRRRAESLQRQKLGLSKLDLNSQHFVCSIDTILSLEKRGKLTFDFTKQWIIIVDEAHHMIDENKWGKLCKIFPRHRVIGATATPCRLDGVSLKKNKGGVFDELVQAESLQEESVKKLIEKGFLCSFKCYGVSSRIDRSSLILGKHDYTESSLRKETNKHIQKMCGDAVEHYKRLASGKQAVAFCVSINNADLASKQFREAGISAAAIHSNMSRSEIDRIFDLFESKHMKVLCNVDMTGEGVDIPAIEVLIMLRKTASLALYRQWIGRALRPCEGKDCAIIIDHADNIRTHGLPDRSIKWNLEGVVQNQKSNLIACSSCSLLIKAWETKCPECGEKLKNKSGTGKDIEFVDVQLVELYRTKAAQLRNDSVLAASVPEDRVRYMHQNCGSSIGAITTKMAKWFFQNVKDELTKKEVEDFFFKHNNINFWSNHFTFADISKPNKAKCLRVFHEVANYQF